MDTKKRILIMTGWGLPEYAPAAAMLQRCVFKCEAEVLGVSQRYLPEALKQCKETCSEVFLLGIGLTKDPKTVAAELRMLKECGVKVWWISGCPIPQEVAVEFRTKDGGSVFDRVVVCEDGLLEALQRSFPKQIGSADVVEFRQYVKAKESGKSEAAQYKRLFTAADWKHKNDREMGHYPKAIFSLARRVRYADIDPALAAVVDYYNKWGNRALIGTSIHMQEVRKMANRAAAYDDPAVRVLITGPSGTGKETVAQLIHRKSARAAGAFLTFNCACTTESLFESKLFGSVKGAYTDARDSKGLFETAANGTLFLDEVAELNYYMQGQLLRVLQDGDYLKVGESVPRKVDNVRIIAATNKNLAQLVSEGRFREDLYYRLNVIQIRMKALAEHPDDIPQIANSIWYRETGSNLTGDQCSAIAQYDFPGNARELENMLIYARVMEISDFTKLVNRWRRENRDLRRQRPKACLEDDEDWLDAAIKQHVCKVAEKYQGMPMREVAARLRCSENTVRKWLSVELKK